MGTIPASENEFPQVLFAEGAAASTPASGLVVAYAKADGLLYFKDDAGTEYPVSQATDLAAHLADTTDAHDASAVSVLDTAAVFTATNVETALKELYDAIAGGGIPITTIDAKGDILGGTANDTVDNLTVGADGTRLEALASATTGLAWKGARGVSATASGVTSTTTATDTAQAFAGADAFDSDAFHDPASNNTRLTVPTGLGGLYLIVAYASFAANSTGRRTFTFRKGGSTTIASDRRTADASGGGTLHAMSALAVLAAADYVELVGNQNSGGNLDMNASNTFGMIRLGV